MFAAETVTAKLNVLTTENTTAPITFTIEANQTTVKGNCIDKWQEKPANYLEVSFFPNGKMPPPTYAQYWVLKLWFSQLDGVSFNLADYSLEIQNNDEFKTVYQILNKSATADLDVKATGTNGFKCSTTGLSLATTEGATTGDSTIDVKDMRVIANARLETPDFPAEQTFEQCLLDSRTSDIVPIVVGACLAGLVAVVLIAYLVGRARAKRQGYASV